MEEKLVKSKKRIQDHGEVFTPSWMVDNMLKLPGIKEATEDIYTTFLEPAAGDGNFLIAILDKKLDSVKRNYNRKYWKSKSLIALTSIYGIEYLSDNLEVARSRMFIFYLNWYEKNVGIHLNSRDNEYKSAYYIIDKNIVRGDTLSKKHPVSKEYIQMSEWVFKNKSSIFVQEKKFYLAELLNEPFEETQENEGQLAIFDINQYSPLVGMEASTEISNEVKINEVYKLGD